MDGKILFHDETKKKSFQLKLKIEKTDFNLLFAGY